MNMMEFEGQCWFYSDRVDTKEFGFCRLYKCSEEKCTAKIKLDVYGKVIIERTDHIPNCERKVQWLQSQKSQQSQQSEQSEQPRRSKRKRFNYNSYELFLESEEEQEAELKKTKAELKKIKSKFDSMQAELVDMKTGLANVISKFNSIQSILSASLPMVNESDLINFLMNFKPSIIILVGAGISTAAGVPDFRSPNGIFKKIEKKYGIEGMDVFSPDILQKKPHILYGVLSKLNGNFRPTKAHRFMELINRMQLLKRVYTQNIDLIESKLDIEQDKIINCHGSLKDAHCLKCSNKEDISELTSSELKLIPSCKDCAGLLHPGITLYGEDLPESFHKNRLKDLLECDLLIVIGTSLNVDPIALFPDRIKSTTKIVVFDNVLPEVLDHKKFENRILFLQGDIETNIEKLCKKMGNVGLKLD